MIKMGNLGSLKQVIFQQKFFFNFLGDNVGDIYTKFHDQDGFLYIYYTDVSTFG